MNGEIDARVGMWMKDGSGWMDLSVVSGWVNWWLGGWIGTVGG